MGLAGAPDDLESQIEMSNGINDNPRLLLCSSCNCDYMIPSYCCFN